MKIEKPWLVVRTAGWITALMNISFFLLISWMAIPKSIAFLTDGDIDGAKLATILIASVFLFSFFLGILYLRKKYLGIPGEAERRDEALQQITDLPPFFFTEKGEKIFFYKQGGVKGKKFALTIPGGIVLLFLSFFGAISYFGAGKFAIDTTVCLVVDGVIGFFLAIYVARESSRGRPIPSSIVHYEEGKVYVLREVKIPRGSFYLRETGGGVVEFLEESEFEKKFKLRKRLGLKFQIRDGTPYFF